MIIKLSNDRGVELSSIRSGQRELLREYRNKLNELIDWANNHQVEFEETFNPIPEEESQKEDHIRDVKEMVSPEQVAEEIQGKYRDYTTVKATALEVLKNYEIRRK